jgi:large subunit ribosomal protein L21
MYAIVKTGGKQYRVQPGQSLLVERLPAADGDTVALQPLLLVDGADVIDGDALAEVKVEAKILAHERGPKLRVVKFKPKRGYKRRTGHRQELTRIEITSMGKAARPRKRAAAKSKAESAEAPTPVAAETPTPVAATAPATVAAEAPATVAAEAPPTEAAEAPATEAAEEATPTQSAGGSDGA